MAEKGPNIKTVLFLVFFPYETLKKSGVFKNFGTGKVSKM
jgi:hypothetical protein